MKRNVLIFHLGALGDFVLTWPLALALGRLYPQSRIFYVTHGGKGQLAEKALRLDSADIEGGWQSLFSANASLPPPARKLLESAHTVVTFLSDGKDTWADNVRRIAPGVNLVDLKPPTLNAPPIGEHASMYIERQLSPWPALGTAVQQITRSITDRGVSGRALGGNGILIHPGSGAALKCWPIDHFIELARKLNEGGREVRWILGEVELERWPVEAIKRLEAIGTIAKPSTPVELWELIGAAWLFIGNDSGPAHLAGMAGVPTVAIFGPTSAEIWHPLGPNVACVPHEDSKWPNLGEVMESVESII